MTHPDQHSFPPASPRVLEAARKVRVAVFDVDGVLTDGKLYYGNHGEELKTFNTQDGLGIKLLQKSGIKTGIITARNSEIVKRRASELGIDYLLQGREDKLTALEELMREHFPLLSLKEVAYMGDDLPDLPAIRSAGLGMTVANACVTVARYADWQSACSGGSGAVRESIELILGAQDKFDTVLQDYLL